MQFNPERLSRLRRDKALIAAAGPLSNLVLGVLLTLIVRAMLSSLTGFTNFTENFFYILFYAAAINFGLFIFNLLPIPPLDGSRILRNFLPYNAMRAYDSIGIWVSNLLMIFVGGYVLRIFMGPANRLIYAALASL